MSATPRPWTNEGVYISQAPLVHGPDFRPVLDCRINSDDDCSCGIQLTDDDAKLIVRAVNAFEPLVEALTRAREVIEPGSWDTPDDDSLTRVGEQTDALLSQIDTALRLAGALE